VDDPIPHNIHSLEDLDDLLTTIGTQGIDVLEDQQKLPSSALKKEFEEEVEPSEDIVLDLPPGALEKTNDLVRIYLFQQPDNGHSGDCGRTGGGGIAFTSDLRRLDVPNHVGPFVFDSGEILKVHVAAATAGVPFRSWDPPDVEPKLPARFATSHRDVEVQPLRSAPYR